MLKVNGLEMLPTFPKHTFERIYEAAERHSRQANHFQFHGAWNAVAYRFQAINDYDHSFTASIRLHGPGAAQPTRYDQERDLFGFVSNAYSMFDAFHYGMFAIGSFLVPATFPLSTPDD